MDCISQWFVLHKIILVAILSGGRNVLGAINLNFVKTQ